MALVIKAGSRPPWVGLGAAVWVQVAAGSAFAFPLYSPSLKSVLGLNQQQLTILGVANDIGENVGTLPGIASNRLPPWAVLAVGALCGFLGFGVLWLAVSQTVTNVPYLLTLPRWRRRTAALGWHLNSKSRDCFVHQKRAVE